MRLERSRVASQVRGGVDVRRHEDLHVGEVRQRRLLVAPGPLTPLRWLILWEKWSAGGGLEVFGMGRPWFRLRRCHGASCRG